MSGDTDIYTTLTGVGEGLYKEKGSKFLAFSHHVDSEAEAMALVEHYRKKYFDARHHCYAWMLGPERTHFRASDDGEPSGTAGKPILNQILSAGITNVLVVVIRWFGGIKLGTSGLIQAYKEAARAAIENASKEQRTVDVIVTLTFAYPLLNEVMRICKEWKVNPNLEYGPDQLTIKCHIRKSFAKDFAARLSAIYGVKVN
ncbi:MAG: YigZ family protein [Bacteroidetes bacterium]|nr:YigZ family protein [Bacteroidota bacterium]